MSRQFGYYSGHPVCGIFFDTVRDVALTLPGAEESTTQGARALKVRGKLLVCIPVIQEAEPDSHAIRVDSDDR